MKAKTALGLEVSVFCARYGMSLKELAAREGTPYDSLQAACDGRRAGHATEAAVRPVMERYEAEARNGRGA